MSEEKGRLITLAIKGRDKDGKETVVKRVSLRPAQNGDTLNAAKLLGQSEITNQFAFILLMAHEVLKLRVVKVDGKKLSAAERETIDKVLSTEHYEAVVHQIGTELKKKPAEVSIEFETDGSDS